MSNKINDSVPFYVRKIHREFMTNLYTYDNSY